jgi:hypothetical protein
MDVVIEKKIEKETQQYWYCLRNKWNQYLSVRSVDKGKAVFGNIGNAIVRFDKSAIEREANRYGLKIVTKF